MKNEKQKEKKSGKGWVIASLLVSATAVAISRIRFHPKYMPPTRTDPNK